MATDTLQAQSALATAQTDAEIKNAWRRWQEARRTYNALPLPGGKNVDRDAVEAEENHQWAVMDKAEETIRTTTATTKEGAAIQLWVALAHSIDTQGQDEAIARADLAPILATESSLDWNARLIVAALRSLETIEA